MKPFATAYEWGEVACLAGQSVDARPDHLAPQFRKDWDAGYAAENVRKHSVAIWLVDTLATIVRKAA